MLEQVGNYYIRTVAKIGEGGFGTVEKVELFSLDNKFSGHYARKTFNTNLVRKNNPGISTSLINEFLLRFKREVIYQSKCFHDNVAHIYLHNLSSDSPYFIMGLAKNDLAQEINNSSLNREQIISIIHMLLNGLSHIHKNDYLHRDIKPQNVLKYDDDIYKISDFGLAKDNNPDRESQALTKIATRMGTDRYMAPESRDAGIYTKVSDIYSLGVLLAELALDTLPELQDILDKCMNNRAPARYQTVDQLYDEINKKLKL